MSARMIAAIGAAAVSVAALVVAPMAFAADVVTAQYRTSASGATTDQVEPWFKLVNTGGTTVPLTELKVRYYFKSDTPDVGYRFACSWAVRGCANVTGAFGTLTGGAADRYLEVGFTSGAGSLGPAPTPVTCNCGSTGRTGGRSPSPTTTRSARRAPTPRGHG